MKTKGMRESLYCKKSKGSAISCIDCIRTVLLIFYISLSVNDLAFAEHVDVAPLSSEVIDTIVSNYTHNKSDPAGIIFQQVVSQTVDLLNEMENTKNTDTVALKAQLLEGIILKFKTLQNDIVNNVYTSKSDHYKRLLIKRFEYAINTLNSVLVNPDRKNINKAEKLFLKIKTGDKIAIPESDSEGRSSKRNMVPFTAGPDKPLSRSAPSINPEPNYRQVIPKKIKERSKKAPLPAYTLAPIAPNNLYASNDVLYLSAAPMTPVEASTCSYNSNDLSENTEVKLTSEIMELAEQLNYSPAKIFSYVANNIEFEPYYGSLKGSQGTLISGAGNATDHASLLIALLRASNIPSRYVKGTVRFENDQRLLDWIGVKTQYAAASVLSSGSVPTEINGNTVSFTHVWVEACLPYNNYRGSARDNSGHRWVPLDASFKNKTYQQGIQLNVDFDYDTYMSERKFDLPNEYFHNQVTGYVKTQPPRFNNNTIEDVPYIGTIKPIKVDIIPASLPYTVQDFLAWGSTNSAETSTVNSGHRLTFTINIKSNAATKDYTALQHIDSHNKGDITFNMSDIILKRVTLDSYYQSNASAEDAARQDYLNWLATQDVSVQNLLCRSDYKARIRLDGAVQNLANVTNAARCATYGNSSTSRYYPWADTVPTDEEIIPKNTLTMTIRLDDLIGTATNYNPEIINKVKYNGISSFEYHALQAYGFQASDQLLNIKAGQLLQAVRNNTDPNAAKDEILGRYLDLVGLKYMRYITDANKDIGQLYGETGNSGNHIGLTSSHQLTSYLFDLPYAVTTSGFLIDVQGALSTSTNIVTGVPDFNVFLLGGYASSAYESYIWQENARMDAVSSVRGIQYARENNIEILEITSSNKDAQLYKLTHNTNSSLNYSDDTVKTIRSLVNAGQKVLMPRSLIDYNAAGQWVGQVYIATSDSGNYWSALFAIGPYAGGYAFDTFDAYTSPSLSSTSSYSSLTTDIPGWNVPIASQPTTSTISSDIRATDTVAQVTTGVTSLNTTAGDPVNMVTGNMYHTEKDISIDGRGLPMVFERTYNSMVANADNAQTTPLGYGWTHSFNHFLEFNDDDYGYTVESSDSDGLTSSVTWVDGTYARKHITVTGNSAGVSVGAAFQHPEGFHFEVNRLANGKYTIREKNGLTYTFANVAGTVGQKARLEKINDRNNNTLTLTYSGNNLYRVTDNYNRYLQFAYNTANQIDSIIDWAGRVYEYKYDASNNLKEFHNPLAVAGMIQPVKYTYYSAEIHNNLNHMMQSYTLPKGNGMTFEYYTNGKVFRHTNTNGESVTFTYNDFRREATTINERGYKRKYFFDANGSPTKIVKEGGGETTYTYDTDHYYNRTGQSDPMGYETAYEYDNDGNVTKITNPSGTTIENSYFNAFHQIGKVKDANGNYTLYKYDASGNKTDVIRLKPGYGANVDPAAYSPSATPSQVLSWTTTSYDGYGNPLVIKQVRNFSTLVGPTIEYDYTDTVNNVNGLHPTTITRCGDRDGDTIIDRPTECDSASLTYDALGRLISGIDKKWYLVTYSYDDVDRVVTKTDADGNQRVIEYDDNGNPSVQKLLADISGTPTVVDQTTTSYDLSDRAEQTTNNAGVSSYYQYDASGNVINVTDPDGHSIAFNYDANNEVISAYDEEGHAVSKGLDISGRVRGVLDPNGNPTTFEYYDGAKDGRLKRRYDAAGRFTEFDYDLNGNVTSVTAGDPSGTDLRTTLSEYDALNRPVRIVGPIFSDPMLGQIRQVTTYQYDNLGNQTHMYAGFTDSSGTNPASDNTHLEEILAYDDLGRVLTKTDVAGNSWHYEYDSHGNATRVIDPVGHIQEGTYTNIGLLDIRTVYDYVGDPAPHVTNYDYNALGQITSVTTPEITYSYEYDAAHRLSKKTDSRAGKYRNYDYTPGGLLTAVTDSEGNVTDYLYDPVGRLTNIWAANGDLVNFNYDPAGRLVEKWFSNGVDTRISYNTDNTISEIVNRAANGDLVSQHLYGYDGHGNRNALEQQIAGNVSSIRYEYDELGRLTATKDAGSNALLDAYSYDHWNNRTSTTSGSNVNAYIYDTTDPKQLKEIRQTDANGALLASFSYDANGNIVGKSEGSNTLTLDYDALNRLSTASRSGQPAESYQYDPKGNRIAKTVGGSTTYYLYQGPDIAAQYENGWSQADYTYTHGPQWDDPLIRTDASDMSQYYHQDGLGSVVSVTNMAGTVDASARYDAWGVTKESNGSIPQYGYTGREPDATGLIYYRARYYDPAIGRFTQRDPKGYIDGVNRYAYAVNNPVNYRDPRGTESLNASNINSVTQSGSYYSSATVQSYDAFFAGVGIDSTSQSLTNNAIQPADSATSFWDNPGAYLPSIPQGTVDLFAGFGSGMTGGLTDKVNEFFGNSSAVNTDSGAYLGGSLVGELYSATTGSVAILSGASNISYALSAASILGSSVDVVTGNGSVEGTFLDYATAASGLLFDQTPAGRAAAAFVNFQMSTTSIIISHDPN